MDPTEITFDLSEWEGETVRPRFASADNMGAFRFCLDDIWAEVID
jgi:hypothetical protein